MQYMVDRTRDYRLGNNKRAEGPKVCSITGADGIVGMNFSAIFLTMNKTKLALIEGTSKK